MTVDDWYLQMFSQMLKTGHEVNIEHVTAVLAATATEIAWDMEKLENLDKVDTNVSRGF